MKLQLVKATSEVFFDQFRASLAPRNYKASVEMMELVRFSFTANEFRQREIIVKHNCSVPDEQWNDSFGT